MLGSVLLQAAGTAHESFLQFLGENLELFLTYTGVYNATPGHLIMILVGLLFIFLAIKYEFEPMLLIPLPGCNLRMVSAVDLPRYRGHDRFLRIDLQS